MAIKWKNTTTYSRDEYKENKEARTVTTGVGKGARLVVTRMYRIEDTWFTHFYGGNFKEVELQAKDLEGAKAEAVKLIKQRLKYLLQQLEGV